MLQEEWKYITFPQGLKTKEKNIFPSWCVTSRMTEFWWCPCCLTLTSILFHLHLWVHLACNKRSTWMQTSTILRAVWCWWLPPADTHSGEGPPLKCQTVFFGQQGSEKFFWHSALGVMTSSWLHCFICLWSLKENGNWWKFLTKGLCKQQD